MIVNSLGFLVHFYFIQILKEYNVNSIVDIGGKNKFKGFFHRVITANIRAGINGTNLTFPSNSFDASVSIATLEHVGSLKQRRKFLLEANRVSRILSLHWFPFGSSAQKTEGLKKELGYKHSCELPICEDFCVFNSFRLIPFTTIKEHLLILASNNKLMHNKKVYDFILRIGNDFYGTILIVSKNKIKK